MYVRAGVVVLVTRDAWMGSMMGTLSKVRGTPDFFLPPPFVRSFDAPTHHLVVCIDDRKWLGIHVTITCPCTIAALVLV